MRKNKILIVLFPMVIFKISEIDLDDFDQIKIYVESDVVIKQGSKSKIQLEGNVSLVDSIYSNV